VYPEGDQVVDAYSGQVSTVEDGTVTLTTDFDTVLLEAKN
jgi:hypothetical protein